MPPPLRRSGSGLLQNPWPGLLPSPLIAGLGPLGPSLVVLATRQSSPMLRPTASLLLASTLGSRLTLEVDFRAPLVACPGGTHTRRSFGPLLCAPLLRTLSSEQVLMLAARWKIEPGTSRALLQAVAKNRHLKSEEAVAIAALTLVPPHVAGDEGWSAVRTLVHGGRVLGALDDLSPEQVSELWAPLEPVIPFASLSDVEQVPPSGLRTAVGRAIKTMTRPPRSKPAGPPAARAPAPYGPNHAEVAAFIKGVAELSPIQWLRVLDRRKLVASVTRESAAEPAGVVRSMLAALEGTRNLDMYIRCRAFAAVERAGYTLESSGPHDLEQILQVLTPFEPSVVFEELNGGGFAHMVAALAAADWNRVAAATHGTNEEAVAPLVNAGTALIDFFGGRSDDEAVATWHAVAALVQRQQLTPIKFAASYAPFASAIPVTNPRSLGALVSRYVTAVGRLGARSEEHTSELQSRE